MATIDPDHSQHPLSAVWPETERDMLFNIFGQLTAWLGLRCPPGEAWETFAPDLDFVRTQILEAIGEQAEAHAQPTEASIKEALASVIKQREERRDVWPTPRSWLDEPRIVED